jgi:uncharacterized protein YqgC (DUF456 family)
VRFPLTPALSLGERELLWQLRETFIRRRLNTTLVWLTPGLGSAIFVLMTTTEWIIGLSVTLVVMLLAFGASIIPGFPGPPIVLLAAVGHRLWFAQHGIGATMFVCLLLLTLVSIALDFFASLYGAKKFGATWRGVLGAFVGGVVGIFFSLPGIILGPFLGALIFELLGGRKLDKASRAGLGATLGVFAGVVGKCVICAMMIGLFTVDVIWRK